MAYDRYLEKNNLLKGYAAEISPMEFYRDMFPVGSFEQRGCPEEHKANGILWPFQSHKFYSSSSITLQFLSAIAIVIPSNACFS